MWQQALVTLGLSSLFQRNDGLAISTVVVLLICAFWSGLLIGIAATLLCVSPSLRLALRRLVLRLLLEDEPARHRLAKYRRD